MTTHDVLKDKHPIGKLAFPEALLSDILKTVNPIIYSNLGSECILDAALHTQGAAGLSGLDAYPWKRLCSSFKSASHDLCHAFAAMSQRIFTSTIHPDNLSALVACHLIPVKKCPCVRPIGIGEFPSPESLLS